ncbi:MAG: hypothetical protein DMF99_26150 [Acidobacteria bacterium]|nr:MAG: hypothetical protein DMF99_26150 [Acidobacteriota bacterium]
MATRAGDVNRADADAAVGEPRAQHRELAGAPLEKYRHDLALFEPDAGGIERAPCGVYVRGDEPRDQARSDGEQSAAAKRDVLSRERRRDSGELTGLKLHVDRDVSHGAEAQVQDSGAFRSGRFRPIAIETVAETAAPSAGRYAD